MHASLFRLINILVNKKFDQQFSKSILTIIFYGNTRINNTFLIIFCFVTSNEFRYIIHV